MRKNRQYIIAIFSLFFLCSCLSGCDNKKVEPTPIKEGNSTITYNLGEYEGAFINGDALDNYGYLDYDYVLPSALCEGYRFDGWYDNASFDGEPISSISYQSTKDYNLYAKFTKTTAKVFLLAGQSNASGMAWYENLKFRNLIDSNKYAEYQKGYKNVKIDIFNDVAVGTTTAGGNITDSFKRVRFGYGSTMRNFGAEVGIAEKLAEEYPNEIIYIIKYARGAMRLKDQFLSPSSHGFEGPLYTGMINRFDVSMNRLIKSGLDPKVYGFIWIQGESDAAGDKNDEYLHNAVNLIDDVREHFDDDFVGPNGISYIQVGISDHWTNYTSVNRAKETIANNSNIAYYSSVSDKTKYHYNEEGKPDAETGEMASPDLAHYDSLSMLQIGNDVGEIMASILKENKKEIINPDYHKYRTTNRNISVRFNDLLPTFSNEEEKIWVGKEGNFVFIKWDFIYTQDVFKAFAICFNSSPTNPESKQLMYFKVKYSAWAGNFLIGGESASGAENSWTFAGLAWRGMYIGFSHPFPEENDHVSLYIICEPVKIGIQSIPNIVYCSNSLSSTYSGPNDSKYKDPNTYSAVQLDN